MKKLTFLILLFLSQIPCVLAVATSCQGQGCAPEINFLAIPFLVVSLISFIFGIKNFFGKK